MTPKERAEERLALLTEREREAAIDIARGRTIEDTARWLGISPHTAKFHRNNAYRATGAVGHVHLATLVVVAGRVSPEEVVAGLLEPSVRSGRR